MAGHYLQDVTPSAIIAAIEDNFVGYTSAYVRTAGELVHQGPELTWLYTGTPLAYYNGVIRTDLPVTASDATIDVTLAYFQSRRQRMSWWVTPSSRPDDLAQRLLARSLSFGWRDVGMAVDLHALLEPATTPPGLAVARVEDENTLRDWLEVFGQGFELDDEAAAAYA